MVRKIILLSLIFSSVSLISGCNTVAGFGHDVSNTGHAITRAAY